MFLDFSNAIEKNYVKQLAESDDQEVVKEVHVGLIYNPLKFLGKLGKISWERLVQTTKLKFHLDSARPASFSNDHYMYV